MTFAALKKDSAFKRLRKPKFKLATPPRPKAPDETPDEYDRLKRLLGDAELAKRVLKLQAKYPQGTTPELVFLDWLERKQYRYLYQIELFGGRRKIGGLVPDFLVITGRAQGIAVGVDGTYWHSLATALRKDETYRYRILGQYFQGYKITEYVRMAEDKIYARRPLIFQMAVVGIELN